MSILFATMAIPVHAASDPRPACGMRRAVLQFAAIVVVWACAVLHIFPLLAK